MDKIGTMLFMYDCLLTNGSYKTDQVMKKCGITSVLTFHRYNMDLKKHMNFLHKDMQIVYIRSKKVYQLIKL